LIAQPDLNSLAGLADFQQGLKALWREAVNLKQLADLLSLSQTTVSRALNGYPEVAEETRRKVEAAAKRYGYRPNPSARRLATGKAGMIGYVMPTGATVDIDPHFVEFLSGLGDYARSHELDLALSPTTVDDEEVTYRRVVANKQVDAVYVSAPRAQDRRIRLLEQLGFPTSCMAARKGSNSNIRSSTSTMRALFMTQPGCSRSSVIRAWRSSTATIPRPSPSTANAACAGRSARRDYGSPTAIFTHWQ
jgi:transcriptional regulator with XRE-family HTH domain